MIQCSRKWLHRWRRRVRIALLIAPGLLAPASAGALDAGDAAPVFDARALDGKSQLSLKGYRGKVVYLDFWASWCAPCLVSLPQLDTLRQEFPKSDFQVVAVNVDKDVEAARRFLGKHPVGYPSATDPEGRLPETFEIETMPTSFLIDRNGVIRYVHRGYRNGDIEKLRHEIEKLVKAGQ